VAEGKKAVMIRVVFFDLGLTLLDAKNRPFPGVPEALRAIQELVTKSGKPLLTGLVSDFEMPSPPATSSKVRAIFEKYLAVLDESGLRPLFEPVQRRVTLSTHAGVRKPDRRVFTTAVTRLRSKAGLDERAAGAPAGCASAPERRASAPRAGICELSLMVRVEELVEEVEQRGLEQA